MQINCCESAGKCGGCKFWLYQSSHQGQCRIKAPVADANLPAHMGPSPCFPRTRCSDWCGEWKALSAEPEAGTKT